MQICEFQFGGHCFIRSKPGELHHKRSNVSKSEERKRKIESELVTELIQREKLILVYIDDD